jgi:hypothetical protein
MQPVAPPAHANNAVMVHPAVAVPRRGFEDDGDDEPPQFPSSAPGRRMRYAVANAMAEVPPSPPSGHRRQSRRSSSAAVDAAAAADIPIHQLDGIIQGAAVHNRVRLPALQARHGGGEAVSQPRPSNPGLQASPGFQADVLDSSASYNTGALDQIRPRARGRSAVRGDRVDQA